MMVTSLLFISHLVGDFVLQSSSVTEEKQHYFSKLLKHCIIYTSVIAIVLLLSADSNKFPAVIIIGLSHLLIDYIRVIYDKKATEKGKLFSYFIDQLLHILVICFVVLYFDIESHIVGLLKYSVGRFGTTHTNNYIIYALLYLTMLQPAAITVKKILIYISGSDKETPPYNAGYLIGILERIIITTLVLQNQLSAIGFVLAAKSIARFNQLNDKEFAEKYLVGTLTSIVISFITTTMLKNMII